MSRLQIALLGAPTLRLDGQSIVLDRWKAVALLAYLVLEPRLHRRDALATLFWPDLNQAQARNGLRRVLNTVHHALGNAWLHITRETVEINRTAALWVDVWHFRELLAPLLRHEIPTDDALQQAVALYQADLLTGFTLRDAPAFEDWRYFAAEELRQLMVLALRTLLQQPRTADSTELALRTARRWLVLDPLEEEAHQALIRLQLAAGDRAAALRQYDHCRQLLAQELGVEPSAATQALLAEPPSLPTAVRRRSTKAVAPAARLPTAPIATRQDEIRQVVVLNVGLIAWPDAKPTGAAARQLESFLATMRTTMAHYAAHLDYEGAEGALAIFGIPYSHEDDAERAVHAAIMLADAAQAQTLHLAIGIKIGALQVTSATTADETTVMHVFGAVMGQAAELQRAAALDQILVDRATYRHTRHSFVYHEQTATLRGQHTSITVYAATGLATTLQKTRGIPGLQAPLIGRAQELQALTAAIHHLTTGRGQVVLLVGEAGIGKSRLVNELWQRRPTTCRWLEGRCLEMTTATSYWPFQQALRTYFGCRSDDQETIQTSQIRAGLAQLQRADLLNTEACVEIGAVLGKLFTLYYHDAWDQHLADALPAEVRYRTMTALRMLLSAIAQAQPLLLILEDLHWADDATLDLLNELLAGVPSTPLLLLCLYRPLPERRCMQLPLVAAHRCPLAYQEVVLRELAPDQNQQMVEALLTTEALLPQTKSWIVAHTQGNPYFTEEVILALIDGGIIEQQAGVWQTKATAPSEVDTIALSYGLDHLIRSRFDRLSPAVRQVLEAAAVWGQSFLLPLLHAVVAAPTSVPAAIAELELRGFIYCEQREPVAEFSFRHVLTQAAIYQTLTDTRRQALHQRALHALEAHAAGKVAAPVETLAYHAVRAADHEKAVTYLAQAGAKARRTFANGPAIAYFQQALDQLAQLDDATSTMMATWSEIWSQLGRVYHATGRYQLAEQAFQQAITYGEAAQLSAPAIVRLLHWRGETLYWQNKITALRDGALAGLARLSTEPSCVEQVLMLSHLNSAYWSLDELDASRAAAQQVIPLIAQFPLIEELWPAYHTVIDYFKETKEAEQALAWIDLLQNKAAARQERLSLAKAVLLRGVTLSELGDLHAAQPVLQEALAMSQRIGETMFHYHCLHRLAINGLLLGETAAAAHYVDELLTLLQQVEPRVPDHYAFCGYILVGAGQLARGLDLLMQADTASQSAGLPPSPEHRLWLGQALARLGHYAEAQAQLQHLLTTGSPQRRLVADYLDLHPTFPAAVAAFDRLLDEPAAFQRVCDQVTAPSQQPPRAAAFQAWYPRPAGLATPERGRPLSDADLSRWHWSDPLGGGSYQIEDGVEISAAAGRDLWFINLSAPMLRTAVTGDFVLQVCVRPSPHWPTTMGGIVLWHSPQAFVRLDWGGLGPGEISCLGCTNTQEAVWGRGRTHCPQPQLRLERTGEQLRALFSEEGDQWWLVGEVTLASAGAWEVGLYAQGLIDRLLYPQAPASGAALRFTKLRFKSSIDG